MRRTPSLDAGAGGTMVNDTDSRAMHRCALLGMDASVDRGNLGAPVAIEVGLVGHLIEFNNKDVDPLADPIVVLALWLVHRGGRA